MIISVFDSIENIVGKGENAGYQQFLLFPQCFEKASFPETSKGVIVREWVKFCWKKNFNPFLHHILILTWKKKKKNFRKTLLEKAKLLKISNFNFFHKVFCAICILKKSSISHISVVVYSFFEFGTVSKWCIREWVNSCYQGVGMG